MTDKKVVSLLERKQEKDLKDTQGTVLEIVSCFEDYLEDWIYEIMTNPGGSPISSAVMPLQKELLVDTTPLRGMVLLEFEDKVLCVYSPEYQSQIMSMLGQDDE